MPRSPGDGWAAAALMGLGAACAPVPSGPAPGPEDAAARPASATEVQVSGHLLVGKDGFGLTPCGERQRIVRFSPAAQAVVDGYIDRSGRLDFDIEARAMDQGGHLLITAVDRILPADEAADCAPPEA